MQTYIYDRLHNCTSITLYLIMNIYRRYLPRLCRFYQYSTTNALGSVANTLSSTTDRDKVRDHARMVLTQHQDILEAISQEDYIKTLDNFFAASIGKHLRHSRSHFENVLDIHSIEGAAKPIVLQYDERSRGGAIETDKSAALKFQSHLVYLLDNFPMEKTTANIHVEFKGIPPHSYTMPSSWDRELSFVTHHAVHHLSTMKLMLNELGYKSLDKNIGLASSTIIHNGKI